MAVLRSAIPLTMFLFSAYGQEVCEEDEHNICDPTLLQTELHVVDSSIEFEPASQPDQTCSPEKVVGPRARPKTSGDFPVDVVYTWVDQPTQEGLKEIEEICNTTVEESRFREMGLLKFSLRLLEQHLPWVRTVFLVTDGRIPTWIRTDSPKLKLVQHRDIWPQDRLEQDLPVFNSQPIETHLHRIPGLSEQFVYFNDDMFVGRPLNKSYFFSDDGKPVLRFKSDPKKRRDENWCSAEVPGSLVAGHMPYSLSVSLIQEMHARWPSEFDKLSAARCRTDKIGWDGGPPFLYQWYFFQSGHAVVTVQDDFISQPFCVEWIELEAGDPFMGHVAVEAWYMKQLADPPDVGCINDCFAESGTDKFEAQNQSLTRFMNEFAGDTPSKFEKAETDETNWLLTAAYERR